jgi:predicted kinase
MSWKFKYYDIEKGPDWDAIEANCSWFRDMKEVPQDKIWHAEGDVQIHTKMVCEALIALPEFQELNEQDKHIMFVGALMHDIEKRSTTAEEFRNGRMCIVAPKHAKFGESTAREILYKEFDCGYYVREVICKIVKWHGKPLHEVEERLLIELSTEVPIKFLAMIAKADILGRICDDAQKNLDSIAFFQMMAEDLGCWDGHRKFETNLARYTYLNGDGHIDYVPFDDKKFTVHMMSALAGTGKDHYIKNNLSHLPVISLDAIREEYHFKPTDKVATGHVVQIAKERAKEYMRERKDFVWNATNITKQMRRQLMDLFESYGGKVKLIYLEVPYIILKSQNGNRDAALPESVIERMIKKWEPPTLKEAPEFTTHIMNVIGGTTSKHN